MGRHQRQMDQPGPPGAVSPQSPEGPERSEGPRRPRRGGITGGDPGGLRPQGRRPLMLTGARASRVDGGERGGTLGRAAAGRPSTYPRCRVAQPPRLPGAETCAVTPARRRPRLRPTASPRAHHLRVAQAHALTGPKACAKPLHAAGPAAAHRHHLAVTNDRSHCRSADICVDIFCLNWSVSVLQETRIQVQG